MPGRLRDVDHLLIDLLVHVTDQGLVGVDDAGHAHLARGLRSTIQSRIVASVTRDPYRSLFFCYRSDIHDALRQPSAGLALMHAQASESRPFDLDAG